MGRTKGTQMNIGMSRRDWEKVIDYYLYNQLKTYKDWPPYVARCHIDVKALIDRDRYILRHRLFNHDTLKNISNTVGISIERTRTIYERFLSKILLDKKYKHYIKNAINCGEPIVDTRPQGIYPSLLFGELSCVAQ